MALPVAGVWGFVLDGVFVGATRSVEMRNGMLISGAAYLATVWVAMPTLGNHGLWLAFLVFLGARGLFLYLLLGKRTDAAFAIGQKR